MGAAAKGAAYALHRPETNTLRLLGRHTRTGLGYTQHGIYH